DDWGRAPLEVLVTEALDRRPELAENRALVQAALGRLRTARWRPLLPSVVLNYNWGGFGGGPKLLTGADGKTFFGESGVIGDFGQGGDFDVSLVWRSQSMGLGNVAEIRDQRLQVEQANVRQWWLADRVVAQVVQALEQVQRARERVRINQAGLFD